MSGVTNADAFDKIIRTELSMAAGPTPTPDLYGIEILYNRPDYLDDGDPWETRSIIMSWLTTNPQKAQEMRHRLMHTEGGVYLAARIMSHDHPEYGTGWTPVSARIVKLAVIPF